MKKLLVAVALLGLAAGAQAADFTLRLGQGGFRDGRAPDGTLGGEQLCVDIEFQNRPVVLSVAQESYTKGPDPTADYEIERLFMVAATHRIPLAKKWPTRLFVGGGVGRLKIPRGESAPAVQAIARVGTKAFRRVGVYSEIKYLTSHGAHIDFQEAVLVVGVSVLVS